MISELNDNDIFDFLMTSDFSDDYSPEELKYLLLKWRYFYRILNGNFERTKDDFDGQIRIKSEIIDSLKFEILELQIRLANRENTIDQLKSRSLSWKERISGKIINNQNEN